MGSAARAASLPQRRRRLGPCCCCQLVERTLSMRKRRPHPEATATSALASYPFLSLEGQAEPSCCLFTVPTLPVLHSLPACDLWELTVPALDSDPSGEALSIQGPLLRRTGARCLSVAERASCVTRGPAHLSIHAPSVISKRMRTQPPQGQGPKATGFPSSFSGRLVPRSAPAWFNNEINSL